METRSEVKVLIVNSYDSGGGAARSAYRLLLALDSFGLDVQMLVQRGGKGKMVIRPQSGFKKLLSFVRRPIDQFFLKLYPNRVPVLFSPSLLGSKSSIEIINSINPDVVHLHWISDGFIRLEDLRKIQAPIVWTFHDTFPFTGGCHVNMGCQRYIEKCGKCPILRSSFEWDLSRIQFLRKQRVLANGPRIVAIGPSKWISNCAKKSALFSNFPIVSAPNLIDYSVYRPLSKMYARQLLNLPVDKVLLAFGAVDPFGDDNKGGCDIVHMNDKLDSSIDFVIFGGGSGSSHIQARRKVYELGRLEDDYSLAALYSAVDVVLVPSRQENLSNVIYESLACGTPVVAYDVGGNSDLIVSAENGYLATPYNKEDLLGGVEYCIEQFGGDVKREKISADLRSRFSYEKIVSTHIALYREICLPEKTLSR